MRVIALDNFDNRREGEAFDCSARQAEQLRKKGLVKIGAKPKNKMAPTPENKSNPTMTAGKERRSSASPAVRASERKIAKQSTDGDTAAPNTTQSLL